MTLHATPASKPASASKVVMTEMVMPNDTNPLNNLMGGRLMYMMDIASAIAARRHANALVVTASVDNISFKEPLPMGSVITIEAQVTRAFRSSMEVYIRVYCENRDATERRHTNHAFFTFVALDESGQKVPVPALVPETDKERQLHEGALRRRQLRLLMGGRMKPEEADELRSLFTQEVPK